MYDVSRSFPAALVFVAGPNAGVRGTAQGAMSRTCSLEAERKYRYDFFEDGLKEALRTGLDAMAAEGVDVALLAKVSCGIYAGPHKRTINNELHVDHEVSQPHLAFRDGLVARPALGSVAHGPLHLHARELHTNKVRQKRQSILTEKAPDRPCWTSTPMVTRT